MQIGILGAGHIGSTVGRLWCEAGHHVRFGTRHPGELGDLVASLGRRASVGTPAEAAEFGEVILLAVPFGAIPDLAFSLLPALVGKVVLDASNPYPERDGAAARQAIAAGHGSSAWTASKLPGARLVKAFNMQRYTELEALAHETGDPLAVILASDDEEALDIAELLVHDAGFEPIVVGSLEDGSAFDPGTPHYARGARASEIRGPAGGPESRSDGHP